MNEPPPYRALMMFLTAARAGRLSDAADRFGVTPSAVSHQIRALEAWIGQSLFERAGRRVSLTPIGRVLRDGAAEAVDRLDEIAQAVRRSAHPGRIVVSAPPAFCSFRLVPAMSACRRALPGVELDLRLAGFDAAVETETVDIAVRFLHGSDEGRRLGIPGWGAVCTPQLYDRIGRPASVSDITSATFVHEEVFNFWPRCFAARGRPVPEDAVFVPLGDALSVLSAVLAGGALGLLPREVTRDLWRQGALLRIDGADVEPDAAFHAVITPSGARKPHVTEILDTIINYLEHAAVG